MREGHSVRGPVWQLWHGSVVADVERIRGRQVAGAQHIVQRLRVEWPSEPL